MRYMTLESWISLALLVIVIEVTDGTVQTGISEDPDCYCDQIADYLYLKCTSRRKLRDNTLECEKSTVNEFRVVLGRKNNLSAENIQNIVRIGHLENSKITLLSITAIDNPKIDERSFAALDNSSVLNFVVQGFNVTYLTADTLAGLPLDLHSITVTNCSIREIGLNVFKPFEDIFAIDLSYNNIEHIPSSFYTDVYGKLDRLILAGNNLHQLDFEAFFHLRFNKLLLDLSDNYLTVQDTINNLVQYSSSAQQIDLRISNNCFCCNSGDENKISRVHLVEYFWQPCKNRAKCSNLSSSSDACSSANKDSYCYFSTARLPTNKSYTIEYILGGILGSSLFVNFLILGIYCCRRRRTDNYIEIPEQTNTGTSAWRRVTGALW